MKNFLKKVSGFHAYESNKEAKKLKTDSEIKLEKFEIKDIQNKKDLSKKLDLFGKQRLLVMTKTIGHFLTFLEIMKHGYKSKTYDLLAEIDIKPEKYITEISSLHMNSTNILLGTAKSASLGAAAISGVPSIIFSGVTHFASASTGTAISTLAGAAKTNAVLAWLGGGSLASGGGGVALGGTLLTAATWTVTGGLVIACSGIIASNHYEKKLTDVKIFQKEVDIHCAKLESNWATMDMIKKRISELSDVTRALESMILVELENLEPLITDLHSTHPYHFKTFQTSVLLVKAMSESVQVPLLTDDGKLTLESGDSIIKTKEILNKTLIRH